MENYEIFKIKVKLDKISDLIKTYSSNFEKNIDRTELLEHVQIEYNQIIKEFEVFEKNIGSLIKNKKRENF